MELINHKNDETYAITQRTSSKEDQVLCQVKVQSSQCHQYKLDTAVVKAAKKACTSYLNQCASAK